MDIVVLSRIRTSDLIREIKEHLDRGYRMQGGVSVAHLSSGLHYTQTMVRDEDV